MFYNQDGTWYAAYARYPYVKNDDVFVGLCLRNGESCQVILFTLPFRKITKCLHQRGAMICYKYV